MKEKVIETRNWMVGQLYRYFLGISFLTIVNFVLLTITASEKVKHLLPFELNMSVIVFLLVPLAFVGVWVFGFFMERYVKYPQNQEKEMLKRSPNWSNVHRKLDEITERIKKMEEKV